MNEETSGYIEINKTLSIRFTSDEAEFINENYERISATPERITYRDFFFLAVQKAVSRVMPKIPATARPEDATEIETLRAQLQDAKAELDVKLAFIDQITERNVALDQEIDRLTQLIDQHAGAINAQNSQIAQQAQALEAAGRMSENTLTLCNMQPIETALLTEYARLMNATPKEVLVEKLFIPTVWQGPGDYIPHLNSAAKRKIREAFQ